MPALTGKTVAITRPAQQAGDMADRLVAAGAAVLVAPAIEVIPPADPAPLDAALGQAWDLVVFTSANAVRHTFARLERLGRAAPVSTRLAAIGEATAAALAEHGLCADVVPRLSTAEGLLAAFAPGELGGLRILLPRAEAGRDAFPDGARALGAEVVVPVAYRTVARPEAAAILRAPLRDGALDAVIFTSPSAVRAIVSGLGADAQRLAGSLLAAIGPTTASALEAAGLPGAVCPEVASGEALAELVIARLS